MSNPGKILQVKVDASKVFQTIDGFGVNINARYWIGSRLLPAMELLVDDLGATLFRVDIWGKSNWIDPTGELGTAALDPAHLAALYQGEVFQRGWAMMRYLNQHNIEPYLTASGDVPHWMLAADGKTLKDYDSFTEMLVSLVTWARKNEGIQFRWFGPVNETDIGSPEGPTISAVDYVRVCELLDEKLHQNGLDDIQLVVPEQANFIPDYLRELVKSPKLLKRIGVFSMHDYMDYTPETYRSVTDVVKNSPYRDRHLWMGEYGDLEQTGEREWYVAWAMTQRLFDHLQAGFSASLVWDAYDNYHDHDESWTIYGLLRSGLRTYTPKKRYYASRQVFRFVPPGWVRIDAHADYPSVRLLAFASPDFSQATLVGMNCSEHPFLMNAVLEGFTNLPKTGKVTYTRTSEHENCHTIANIPLQGSYPFTGIDALLPPGSIFTLTTL
jgi:O-glycosyl hydrolase